MIVNVNHNRHLYKAICFMLIATILMIAIAISDGVSGNLGDVPVGGRNHEYTITPFPPSSCPCGYPDCSCPSENGISITLEPTIIITPLDPLGAVDTPAIPIGVTAFATNTAYPTFVFPTRPPLQPTPGATLAGPTPTLGFHDPNIPRPPDPPIYP